MLLPRPSDNGSKQLLLYRSKQKWRNPQAFDIVQRAGAEVSFEQARSFELDGHAVLLEMVRCCAN